MESMESMGKVWSCSHAHLNLYLVAQQAEHASRATYGQAPYLTHFRAAHFRHTCKIQLVQRGQGAADMQAHNAQAYVQQLASLLQNTADVQTHAV